MATQNITDNTELNVNDIRSLYYGLSTAYEYIHVTLFNDQSKKGITLKTLETMDIIHQNDFHLLWVKFMNDINKLDELNDNDRFTIDLSNYLYDEYGLTQKFRDELRVAIFQNDRFKSIMKSNPMSNLIYTQIYKINIDRPCGFKY